MSPLLTLSITLCTWLFLAASSSVQQLSYRRVKACIDHATFNSKEESTPSKSACARTCSQDADCLSFSFHRDPTVCYLNNITIADTGCSQGSYKHYNLGLTSYNPCFHGGTYFSNTCRCYHGYIGDCCERLMHDCSEGWATNHYKGQKDVFSVHPPTSPSPFKVYCEMVHKGKLAIMRRLPDVPEEDFNRTWAEYRDGFGDVAGNHWLGNQKLFHLSNNRNMIFKTVAVTTDLGTKPIFRQRFFHDFKLFPESDGYRFTFTSQTPWKGNLVAVGDCMSTVQGYRFSTIDKDNDNSGINCAEQHLSGWWYDDCGPCNPTGRLQVTSELYQNLDRKFISAPVESSYAVRRFIIFLQYDG